MCPAAPRPRQATRVPWPIGPGNATVLSAGELFVNAPGIGALGPDHEAAGAATAAPAPRAQIVPAAVTAVASLVMERLDILDLAFPFWYLIACSDSRHGKVTIRSLSRNLAFPMTFLGFI